MKTIVFEGLYDLESGWEFDLPILMVVPWEQEYDSYSSPGNIDDIIEECIINIWEGYGNFSDDVRRNDWVLVRKDFEVLKAGGTLEGEDCKGLRYWKRVVEYDDSDYKIVESVG